MLSWIASLISFSRVLYSSSFAAIVTFAMSKRETGQPAAAAALSRPLFGDQVSVNSEWSNNARLYQTYVPTAPPFKVQITSLPR